MYIRQMNICGHINLLHTLQIHEMWFITLNHIIYHPEYKTLVLWRKTNHDMFVCRNCDPARPVWRESTATQHRAQREGEEGNLV